MKNKELKEVLIDLGLSENEAKVYLSSLALGPNTVSRIAKEANMKRTTVHSLIEPLQQLGLIKIELQGWKKQYIAENPKKLDSILERKRKKFKEKLPDFMSLYNEEAKDSIIRYYEGLEAIKGIYVEFPKKYKARDEILIIGDTTKFLELDHDFFQDIIKKEAKAGIKKRLLLQESEEARRFEQIDKTLNMQVKILSKETSLTTILRIAPDKVFIHHLNPPVMALTIENTHMIKMFKEFFEIMWRATRDNR